MGGKNSLAADKRRPNRALTHTRTTSFGVSNNCFEDLTSIRAFRYRAAVFGGTLSPDGRTLYFTSPKDGIPTLWSFTVAGGAPRELGHSGLGVRFPISPDGRKGGRPASTSSGSSPRWGRTRLHSPE